MNKKLLLGLAVTLFSITCFAESIDERFWQQANVERKLELLKVRSNISESNTKVNAEAIKHLLARVQDQTNDLGCYCETNTYSDYSCPMYNGKQLEKCQPSRGACVEIIKDAFECQKD